MPIRKQFLMMEQGKGHSCLPPLAMAAALAAAAAAAEAPPAPPPTPEINKQL